MKKKLIIFSLLLNANAYADYNFYTEKECPVVGNINSLIYHIPKGAHYLKMLKKNKTADNRNCFKSEKEAVKHGYRRSKR